MNLGLDWKVYAWVRRGKRRTSVLVQLNESSTPVTATDIKYAQGVDITQAAFTLKELWEKKLVICDNPEQHSGKRFTISAKGKEILGMFR